MMGLVWAKMGLKIEGAAAVALAGYFKDSERKTKNPSAVIICGGNIGEEKFKKAIAEYGGC